MRYLAVAFVAGCAAAPASRGAPSVAPPPQPTDLSDVRAWLAQWQAARTCLLGADPVDPAFAYEIVVLRRDPGHLPPDENCWETLFRLGRPVTPAVSSVVDVRWTALEVALDHLERVAIGEHTPPVPGYVQDEITSLGLEREVPLMTHAIHDVDVATDALQAATGLAPKAVTSAPLPAVALGALVDFRRDELAGGLDGFLVMTRTTDRVELDLAGNDTPRRVVARAPDRIDVEKGDAFRSLPDGNWAVVKDKPNHGLRAGSLAPDGTVASTAPLLRGNYDLEAAYGAGSERFVLVSDARKNLALARSVDGGAHWSSPTPFHALHDARIHVDRSADRIDIVAPRRDGTLIWLAIDAKTGRAAAELPVPGFSGFTGLEEGRAYQTWACVSGTTLWYTDDGGNVALRVAPGVAATSYQVDRGSAYAECTPDRAVTRSALAESVAELRADGTVSVTTNAHGTNFVALVPEGVAIVAQEGQVLGIWRTNKPVSFVQIPRDAELRAAMGWSTGLHLLLTLRGGEVDRIQIARVPD